MTDEKEADKEKEICIYKKEAKLYTKDSLPRELQHAFECLACNGYDKKCKYFNDKKALEK